MNRALRILLVEAEPERAGQLLEPLAGRGYKIRHACSAREGLERLYEDRPDLILLGRDLQDLEGLHFCAELKNDIVLRHIPVFFLDARGALDGELAAREAGVDDYLSHPVNIEVLDGRIQQIFLRGIIGVNRHPVTGLPGFNAVYRRIQETLERDSPFAICFLDIGRLRDFNRRYGYPRGDELLRMTAQLVVRALHGRGRHLDFFGHLGADDFVLITEPEDLQGLVEELLEGFDRASRRFYDPADLERGHFLSVVRRGREVRCNLLFLSIAVITADVGRPLHVARIQEQAAELLAMAKKNQKSSWVRERRIDRDVAHEAADAPFLSAGEDLVRQDVGGAVCSRRNLEDRARFFRDILRERALQVFFQPIVYMDTGRVFGYEALLRGPVGTYFESPVTLFSMAREMELVLELDLLSLEKLLGVVEKIPPGAQLFFNVNPESLFSPMFYELCQGARLDLAPKGLVLEVTRKTQILEFAKVREAALCYKGLGFQLALDDAQGGTLSLQTALELSPDYVKTDMSVTRDIDKNTDNQKVFRRFQSFCERHNMGIVAEGVESEEEKTYLVSNGASLAQGYLFAPPRPLPV